MSLRDYDSKGVSVIKDERKGIEEMTVRIESCRYSSKRMHYVSLKLVDTIDGEGFLYYYNYNKEKGRENLIHDALLLGVDDWRDFDNEEVRNNLIGKELRIKRWIEKKSEKGIIWGMEILDGEKEVIYLDLLPNSEDEEMSK